MPAKNNLFSSIYRKDKIRSLSVLGIGGSPRLGGNSDMLLDKALEGAEAAGARPEKIILNALHFVPCQECEVMPDDGSCNVRDDMQKVYPKVLEADALILAAPVFFGSLSAQTKMMIDRFQCLWRAKYVLKNNPPAKKKKAAFICVEASKRDDFLQNARAVVKNFFAVIDADYCEELFCRGVDERGSILRFPDFLEKAFVLGKRLAEAA